MRRNTVRQRPRRPHGILTVACVSSSCAPAARVVLLCCSLSSGRGGARAGRRSLLPSASRAGRADARQRCAWSDQPQRLSSRVQAMRRPRRVDLAAAATDETCSCDDFRLDTHETRRRRAGTSTKERKSQQTQVVLDRLARTPVSPSCRLGAATPTRSACPPILIYLCDHSRVGDVQS